jgi:hypothetical protein
MRRRMTVRFALLAVVIAGLAGCATSYALRGKVVEGSFAAAEFVDEGHEQLEQAGLAYASISIYRDPTQPNVRLVASGRTNGRGEFDIPINEFGTGWMVEQWLVQIVKPGYETLESMLPFPSAGKKKQLLIVLTPGLSLPPRPPRENLWGEAEHYR